MERRRIGSLEVSAVGIGCNNFGRKLDAAGSATVVHAALEQGINFFDNADTYGGTLAEEYLGRALKGRRGEAIIATKFGMRVDEQHAGGGQPEYVRRALEDSLRRLGVDCIDLYQFHQPDPKVPIEETLGAMNDAVREGKVREIGCSNFSAAQLREAQAAVRPGAARFVSVQNQYSLLHREPEREVLPECERLKIAFIPFFPLESGLLTGKYRIGQPAPEGARLTEKRYADRFGGEDRLRTVEALIRFADSRGYTLLELAFSWLLARPAVASVIAGATTPEQVRLNAEAPVWRLGVEDLAQVEAIVNE